MNEDDPHDTKGWIFDVQRFSIHDGPGIRTTVFLKGCPLACVWCHNPEGRTASQQISFTAEKCIGCGYCFDTCPNSAHLKVGEEHVLDRERCAECGECTTECHSGALEKVGREVTASEVMEEVLRDKPFYENSGGGMTLSGGEPLFQVDFADALLSRAKEAGIHCCVETSGYVPFEAFERIRNRVDLFLYDIKDSNDRYHEQFTGVSSASIFDNLWNLHQSGANIVLRLPIIPLHNDRFEHFRGIAALVLELPRIQGVEILPYHRMGSGKLERLGLPKPDWEEPPPPTKEEVATWVSTLMSLGVKGVVGQG